MLISCPQCPRVYEVAASAIPPGGREVACSACGCTWFEQGLVAELIDALAALDDPMVALGLAAPADAEPEVSARPAMAALSPPDAMTIAPPGSPVARIAAEILAPAALAQMSSAQMSGVAMPAGPLASTALTIRPAAPVVDLDLSAVRGAQPFGLWARWRAHRKAQAARQAPRAHISPGDVAAAAFRARQREAARNRLTPLRALGWTAWAATAAALALAVNVEQATVLRYFPEAASLYARLGPAEPTPTLALAGLQQRFAQSLHGPVLELRGVLINTADEPLPPALELTLDGPAGAVTQRVAISDVPIPTGGERPFIVRAQVPAATERAIVRVADGSAAAPARTDGLRLEQRGGGWSQPSVALPAGNLGN